MTPGLGRRIVQARQAAGLTQEALAARIGMNRNSLRLIEQGQTASPGILAMAGIAEACGVSLDWLVGRTPPAHDTESEAL